MSLDVGSQLDHGVRYIDFGNYGVSTRYEPGEAGAISGDDAVAEIDGPDEWALLEQSNQG